MNKKGFTLVELLAVIVILAVVMLIAVTAVGPMMAKARKSSLSSEGIALIKAAESAYNAEIMKGSSARFKATDSICLHLKLLNQQGYFEKGEDDGYSGSVLISYDSTTGKHTYTYWISNGVYTYLDATSTSTDPEAALDYLDSQSNDIKNCGIDTFTSKSASTGEATPQSQANYVACDDEGCYPTINATANPGCASGYTLVNGSCYKTASCSSGSRSGNTCTYIYTKSYYCSSGTKSGSYCYYYTIKTCPSGYSSSGTTSCRSNSTTAKICPSGYTLSGSTCYKYTYTTVSSSSSSCPTGYSRVSSTSCRKMVTTSQTCPTGYSAYTGTCRSTSTTSKTCPSGYSTSGDECRKVAGSAIYGCPSGGSSYNTNQCKKNYTACSNYDSTNDVCLETTGTIEYSYSCPDKYTLNGTTCTYSG